MRCNRLFCIALFLLLFGAGVKAQQLSLGNTPYMMNKSAVLELNSANQGLLLPRITDTSLINALTPPDGMVIYHTPSKQFMLRANGYWNPLAVSASLNNYWNTAGNTTGSIKKLGTIDNYSLPFITNNSERMRLTTSGYLGIGTASPSALLHVSGTNPLTLDGVQNGTTTTADSLLTINNGIVQKLPVSTFQAKINGTGFVKASGPTISYDNNTYTIANSAITGATKTKITYDAKGLVTAGANLIASDIPDLSGTYQPLNGSLTSISGIAGTSGYLKKTAANTYVLDNSSFLTSESDPVVKAINGIVKSNGTTISAAISGTDYVAPNAAITGATKTKITYDSKGLVTSGADATTSDIAEGTNLYYTDTRVRNTPFTGLSTATATSVTATDNLLAGVGKLQGQINAINTAGYLTGNQTITLSGDISGSGATAITTSIGNNKVTLGHMAQVATGSFLGRTTAGTGNVEALTTAQAKTLLGINGSNSGDVSLSGQNYLSLSGQTITANQIDLSGTHAAGTLAAARFGALTGDVTNTAGSYLTTIANGAVTYAKMQNISANNRLLGRATTGAGTTEEITLGSGLTLSGTTLSANGAGQWSTTGNSGTTWNSHFIGTTDNNGFRIRTNNIQRLVIDSLGNIGIANAVPAEKLDVTGNLRFSGALMPNGVAGTSGYVLQSNGAGSTPTWIDPNAAITSNTWLQNGNAVSTAKTLGTTSNYDLPLITNNAERMRITADGRIGIGVTAPANNLAVKDTIEIRRIGSVGTLLFSNTSGSGDLRIAGDGGDIFWQGGGSRNLQMGSYWGMVLGGDRQTGTLPAFTAGTGGTGVLVQSQRNASVPLAVQGAGGQSVNLTEWRNSSNTILNAVTSTGSLGIGTSTPSTKLHVVGTNPLTLNGVQVGGTTTADSVLTINNGTVQKLAMATFATPSNSWATTGNAGINWATNFLGSTNNASLRFRANNTERMILDSNGKLGVGTMAPSELLDVAGNLKFSGALMPNGTAGTAGYLLQSNGAGLSPAWVNGLGLMSSAAWMQEGNSLSAMKKFGTISNHALPFITNNIERMRIDEDGNVGIGSSAFDATSPEKLLIDAGTETYTAMLAKGSINSYFQINVKNTSSGNQSSSDLVATANNGTETTNFVNLGINGSNYVYQSGNPIETGKFNDGYLISSGNDLYIVNNNASKNMIFLTGGTAPTNEAMRITATENVGIGTTTPNTSTKLDVNGSIKIGTAGTVVKNMVTATSTFSSNTTVNAAATSGLGSNITPGTLDVTYTLPTANTLASTVASIAVSPNADLPAGVTIAFARATSTTAIKVRFINNSTTAGTIANGTKLYFTITDF